MVDFKGGVVFRLFLCAPCMPLFFKVIIQTRPSNGNC